MIDPKARSDRWRSFYEEDGGLRDMLLDLRRAYFERAAALGARDTDGLWKLSIASKLVDELDRHVGAVIGAGDIAAQQDEHLARIRKVGKYF
ncbi:hypothetical protein [Sphingopyxis sp. C-1]|uniref:hypothetical protein n=1 Tax=Sphingopyxis sp. C-1 TaxID=262667 RepID=UPI00128BF90E|nr:hypothetical protein [Sphingopyxis sp. C-1]